MHHCLKAYLRIRWRNRDLYPLTTSIMSLSKRINMKMRKRRKKNIILEPITLMREMASITTSQRKMKILQESELTTTCSTNKI
jgi:hypothetical protein